MASSPPWCCTSKKAFRSQFPKVYHGFNEDIWEDMYGGKELDPCCTPMPRCRFDDNNDSSSQSQYQNQSQQGTNCCSTKNEPVSNFNSNNSNNSCCCTSNQSSSSARSTTQTQRDKTCCHTKSSFQPNKIYVGFNESLFEGKGFGGGC